MNEESLAIERYLAKASKGEAAAWKVFHYDEIASTQIEAKRLAAQGASAGTLVIARTQTAGYGRKGDFWHSGAGGLWFSLILKPPFGPDQAERLSVASAQAVAKVLKRHVPEAAFEVKAPNDVLARSADGKMKKVCGLLLEGRASAIETSSAPHSPPFYDWLIIGLGLNVNNKLPPELENMATTLAELRGRPLPRMPLLRDLVLTSGEECGKLIK